MKIIKQRFLASLGWVILIAGLLLYPFPIPGVTLVIILGLLILLPNSLYAKKIYIRIHHKYGKYTGILDRMLRRKKKGQKRTDDSLPANKNYDSAPDKAIKKE